MSEASSRPIDLIFSERPLFGGAITMQLPNDFIDASDLRQVPDTQEVFLSPTSDLSLILEVLQWVDKEDSKEAIKVHFESTAEDNSAVSSRIQEITLASSSVVVIPSATPSPVILYGDQDVPKFNHAAPDRVLIHMALYRLFEKKIDLVLTANIPQNLEGRDVLDVSGLQLAKAIFHTAVHSLRIGDFTLFA